MQKAFRGSGNSRRMVRASLLRDRSYGLCMYCTIIILAGETIVADPQLAHADYDLRFIHPLSETNVWNRTSPFCTTCGSVLEESMPAATSQLSPWPTWRGDNVRLLIV